MRAIRLLIADDHNIVLEGIVSLLQTDPSFQVAGTATNGYEVLDLVEKNDYDVCLLDINMPLLDGMKTAKILRQRKTAPKIIMLTTYNDMEIITELAHIGIAGYLLKNSDRQELTDAIKKVMDDRYYFSKEVEKIILQTHGKSKIEEEITLTDRELEIVRLLAKEYTNDMIASELYISYRTVETHRRNIMQKTQTKNLAGLVQFAINKGLLT